MFFFRCRQNDVAAIDINMGCPKTFSLSVCKANKTSTDIFMCALCFSMKAKKQTGGSKLHEVGFPESVKKDL